MLLHTRALLTRTTFKSWLGKGEINFCVWGKEVQMKKRKSLRNDAYVLAANSSKVLLPVLLACQGNWEALSVNVRSYCKTTQKSRTSFEVATYIANIAGNKCLRTYLSRVNRSDLFKISDSVLVWVYLSLAIWSIWKHTKTHTYPSRCNSEMQFKDI
jgi:hypothetical protein